MLVSQLIPVSQLRLAIVATHPIQYHSPVFRELSNSKGLDVRVFYGWEGTANSIDHGFGKKVAWDIPLLDGYDWEIVPNSAREPGAHHFAGIDLPDLNERIEHWNAGAVLIYGWSYKAHLDAMRHFHGKIPVLFRGDSNLLDETPGIKKLLRRIYLKGIYKNIDFALAVGTNNIRYYEALGLRPEQIKFAPHAIDNARFEENAGEKSAAAMGWRRRLGIEDHHIVLMFVGKLEYKKAPDLMLAAFEQLNAEGMHLVFVGSGELEKLLRSKTSSSRVHFVGFQNQTAMEVVYRMADAVVLPSRGPGETWGLAINEAMACGVAVIASSKVGCAVDLIDPGVNGFVFEANSHRMLNEALKKIQLVGKSGLSQFGARSKKIIQNWTIAKQANSVINLLASLAEGRE